MGPHRIGDLCSLAGVVFRTGHSGTAWWPEVGNGQMVTRSRCDHGMTLGPRSWAATSADAYTHGHK
jgi:hypothetical protein